MHWPRPGAPGRHAAPAPLGAVARLRNARHRGGVVIRYHGSNPSSLRAAAVVSDGRTWTLPKGTPNAGETTEQTALREVAEETGLEVRITAPLDSIEYWFVLGGTRIHKTVHYFLMEPTGGDLAGHDHEFAEVRWVGFDEAACSRSRRSGRWWPRRPPPWPSMRSSRRRPRRRHERGRDDPADALADRHAQLGARLIEFGGWLMPVQYRGILEEHRAVRERVGLFDLSHMGELFVEGLRPARHSLTRSSPIRPRSRMDAPSTR